MTIEEFNQKAIALVNALEASQGCLISKVIIETTTYRDCVGEIGDSRKEVEVITIRK